MTQKTRLSKPTPIVPAFSLPGMEGPPKMDVHPSKKDEPQTLAPREKESRFIEKLEQAIGSLDPDIKAETLHQVAHMIPGAITSQNCNAALAILHEIAPRDGLERMLAIQMIGTHNLAHRFLHRAGLDNQTYQGVTMNVERATKLLRTFTAQLEALNRHRGKGQQKVTVEHVTVNQGGQAIVGAVTHAPGGPGERDKNEQ